MTESLRFGTALLTSEERGHLAGDTCRVVQPRLVATTLDEAHLPMWQPPHDTGPQIERGGRVGRSLQQ
jgi:hypothetical protein